MCIRDSHRRCVRAVAALPVRGLVRQHAASVIVDDGRASVFVRRVGGGRRGVLEPLGFERVIFGRVVAAAHGRASDSGCGAPSG